MSDEGLDNRGLYTAFFLLFAILVMVLCAMFCLQRESFRVWDEESAYSSS